MTCNTDYLCFGARLDAFLKKIARTNWSSRVRLEQLEPRILYSADPASMALIALQEGNDNSDVHASPQAALSSLLNDKDSSAQSNTHLPIEPDSSTETDSELLLQNDQADVAQLVIVDTSTEELKNLYESLQVLYAGSSFQVVQIAEGESGIDIVTALTESHSNLDAIHILSHGSDGVLQLGTDVLNAETLSTLTSTVNSWGQALTENGDVLLYGCNLSQSASGIAFVQALSNALQADVASSDDLTGHRNQNADWDLEVQYGEIETSVALNQQIQDDWTHSLDVVAGLVARYELSGNVQDSVGSADGTAQGALNFTSGLQGDALQDAGSFVVESPAALPIINGSNSTITFWIKPATHTPTTYLHVEGSASDMDILIEQNATGTVRAEITTLGSTTLFIESNTVAEKNRWSFVSLTIDNGIPEISINNSPFTPFQGLGGDHNLGQKAIIGTDSGSGFSGEIEDVRFYDRALSFAERQEVYQALPAGTANEILDTHETIIIDAETTVPITPASLKVTDADTISQFIGFEITALPNFSIVELNGVELAVGDNFTMQDIYNSYVTITSTATFSNTNELQLMVDDGQGTPTSVNLVIVTQSTLNTEESVDVIEPVDIDNGGSLTLTNAELLTTDAEQTASEITYNVFGFPAGISLYKGTSSITSFTQQDIDDELIVIKHDGGAGSADLYEQIELSVDDGYGFSTIITLDVRVKDNQAPYDITLTQHGAAGSGVSLNESGDLQSYFTMDSADAVFGGLTEFTVEANISLSDTGDSTILSYGENDGQLTIQINSSTELQINIAGNSVFVPASDVGDFIDGESHMLSLSWDSATGETLVYLDGLKVANETLAIGAMLDSNSTANVGNTFATNPSGATAFVGSLNELRIFDYVRSHVQIANSLYSELPLSEPGLNGYWTFNEFDNGELIRGLTPDTNLNLVTGNLVFPDSEPVLGQLIALQTAQVGDVVGYASGKDPELDALIAEAVALHPNADYSDSLGIIGVPLEDGTLTWNAAYESASQFTFNGQTGYLATPVDAITNEFLREIAQDRGWDLIWVAGEESSTGNWVWITPDGTGDQEVEFADSDGNSINGQFTAFKVGEPNNSILTPLELFPDTGLWNDKPYSFVQESIAFLDVHAVAKGDGGVNSVDRSLSYSLVDLSVAGTFDIDPDNGQIFVSDALQLGNSVLTEHIVEITVTDKADNTYTKQFRIAIEPNQNTAPVNVISEPVELLATDVHVLSASELTTIDAEHNASELTYYLVGLPSDVSISKDDVPILGSTNFSQQDINDGRIKLHVDGYSGSGQETLSLVVFDTGALSADAAVELNISSNTPPGDLVVIEGSFGDEGLTVNHGGSNDYLELEDASNALGGLPQGTIITEFSLESSTPANTVLFDFGNVAESFSIVLNANNNIEVVSNTTLVSTDTYAELRDGEAHRLAVTWDTLGEIITLSVDSRTENHSLGFDNVGAAPSSGIATLGTYNNGTVTTGSAMHGTWYDFRIYNDDLSLNEIQLAYEDPFNVASNELAVYYTFDHISLDGQIGPEFGTQKLFARGGSGGIELGILTVYEDEPNNTVVGTVAALDVETQALVDQILLENPGLVYSLSQSVFLMPGGFDSFADSNTAANSTLLEGVAGRLPIIQSSEKNELVREVVEDNGWVSSWLAASHSTVTGDWLWNHGPAAEQHFADSSGEAVNGSYVNWFLGEPNGGLSENNLQMYANNGTWNDINNVGPLGYVIEFDAAAVLAARAGTTGGPIQYVLTSQTVAGAFAVDPISGVISVNDTTSINFDQHATHKLFIEYSDSAGAINVDVVDINILDVPNLDTPTVHVIPIDLSMGLVSFDENTPVAIGIGALPAIEIIDPDLDTLLIELKATDGVVSLASMAGLVDEAGTGINNVASIELSGSVADINSALATLTFTPDTDFVGTASIQLISQIASPLSPASIVTSNIPIEFDNVNIAPVAAGDVAVVAEGGTVSVLQGGQASVLTNDIDPDFGDSLSASISEFPLHGALALEVDGTFSYTHDGSENYTDSFEYTVTDSFGASSTAEVVLNISNVNDAPVAINDNIIVAEGGSVSTLTDGSTSILGNDIDNDPGDQLTAQIVSHPANGVVVLNTDGSFTYTQDGSESSLDSFAYHAFDGSGAASLASVSIIVIPVNDAPQAQDDSASVIEGNSIAISVLDNDTDDDGDVLQISLISAANHGSVVINSDNTFSYTHNGSEQFNDSFSYAITDPSGLSDISVVTIDVQAVNENTPTLIFLPALPNINENAVNGTIVATISGSDADSNDALTYTLINDSSGRFSLQGTSIIVADTSMIDYEVADSHSVLVRVEDAAGNTSVEQIDIAINNIPEPITGLISDIPMTVFENSTGDYIGTILVQGVQDSGTLTFSMPDDAGGLFSIDGVTGEITNNIALDFEATANQLHTVSVLVSGSLGSSFIQSFDIAVLDVNETPIVVGENVQIDEGGTLNVAVLDNDVDPDTGDTQSVTITVQPAHGSAFVTSTGQISYTHNGSEQFSDSISYSVTDSSGLTASAEIDISIIPLNDNNPVIITTPQTIVVSEAAVDGTLLAILSSNDVDTNDTVSYTQLGAFTGRFLVDANTGEITVGDASLIDYETAQTHTMDVRAVDSAGNSTDHTVLLNVLNVIEPFTGIDQPALSIAENSPDGTAVGFISAVGVETGNAVTFALVNNAQNRFSIDPVSGLISTSSNSDLDFELNTAHTVSVIVTDATGASVTESVVVNVTDQTESLSIIGDLQAVEYVENAVPVSLGATLTINDPDNALVASLTVSINSGYQQNSDVLAALNTDNISAEFDEQFGVLLLSGLATVQEYTAALQDVTYSNNSDIPSIDARDIRIELVSADGRTSAVIVPLQVLPVNDKISGLPSVVGSSNQQGSVLSAMVDNVMDADARPEFYYQWMRDNTVIVGATSSDYTIGPDDAGSTLHVMVTKLNFDDSAEPWLDSINSINVLELVPEIEPPVVEPEPEPEIGAEQPEPEIGTGTTPEPVPDSEIPPVTAPDIQPEIDTVNEPEPELIPAPESVPEVAAALSAEQIEFIDLSSIVMEPFSGELLTDLISTEEISDAEQFEEIGEQLAGGDEASQEVMAEIVDRLIGSDTDALAESAPDVIATISENILFYDDNRTPTETRTAQRLALNAVEYQEQQIIQREIKLEDTVFEEQLATVLALEPLELEMETKTRILFQTENSGFKKSLDEVENTLKRSAEKTNVSGAAGETVVGVSIGVTAGVLAWMLRGGTLLASVFSVAPLWKQLDPLPIVSAVKSEATPLQSSESVEGLFEDDE